MGCLAAIFVFILTGSIGGAIIKTMWWFLSIFIDLPPMAFGTAFAIAIILAILN